MWNFGTKLWDGSNLSIAPDPSKDFEELNLQFSNPEKSKLQYAKFLSDNQILSGRLCLFCFYFVFEATKLGMVYVAYVTLSVF